MSKFSLVALVGVLVVLSDCNVKASAIHDDLMDFNTDPSSAAPIESVDVSDIIDAYHRLARSIASQTQDFSDMVSAAYSSGLAAARARRSADLAEEVLEDNPEGDKVEEKRGILPSTILSNIATAVAAGAGLGATVGPLGALAGGAAGLAGSFLFNTVRVIETAVEEG